MSFTKYGVKKDGVELPFIKAPTEEMLHIASKDREDDWPFDYEYKFNELSGNLEYTVDCFEEICKKCTKPKAQENCRKCSYGIAIEILKQHMMPGFESVLTISTEHIKPETCSDFLAIQGQDSELCMYKKDEYGFMIFIDPHNELKSIPEDIKDIYTYALNKGYDWIMLDTDGPKYDELPKYVWSGI